MTRRDLLKNSGIAAGACIAPNLKAASAGEMPKGKADACIFIWLGGGASHVDTLDPKVRGDGKRKAGSYYESIDTAIPGVKVCEHLKRTAPLLDRCVVFRSLTHDISGEHAAAANLLHTGRMPSGTIQYPSIRSIVSRELGPKSEAVPSYVVMGYPNITRDPGFLGAKHGYVYLTQIETGPTGLVRAPDVDSSREDRRETLLARMRDGYVARHRTDQMSRVEPP